MSPKQAYRFFRQYKAGLEDPMTEAMGAGEFVHQSASDDARRLGLSIDEIADLALDYTERRESKRLRFKNPARLQWRAQSSYERTFRNLKGV